MLSILIPIYNYDIRDLIQQLMTQVKSTGIAIELRCYDDASLLDFRKINREVVAMFPDVIYQELEHNIGRSKIRNLLAKEARFPYLLYLDCDSEIIRDDFIATYVQVMREDTVCNGGRVYTKERPSNKTQILHWKYGHMRESKPSEVRNKYPVQYFHTNNFVLPKSIFQKVSFNETLDQYGYEDLLFALELQKAGFKIQHIENPVLHKDLQSQEIFLNKAVLAIQNLKGLEQLAVKPLSRLSKTGQRIIKVGMRKPTLALLKLAQKSFLKNLSSSNPNLVCLDLYKLKVYLEEKSLDDS